MDDYPSFRPRMRMSDSTKGWAGILAGVAGVVTAITALNQKPEEKAAKQSYELLSAKIEQLAERQHQMQEDQRRNSEWLHRLRGYVEGVQQDTVDLRASTRRPSSRRAPAPMPTAVKVLPPPPKPKAPLARGAELPPFEQIQQQVNGE